MFDVNFYSWDKVRRVASRNIERDDAVKQYGPDFLERALNAYNKRPKLKAECWPALKICRWFAKVEASRRKSEKAWRERNKEKYTSICKNWRKNNPDKVKEYKQQPRVKLRYRESQRQYRARVGYKPMTEEKKREYNEKRKVLYAEMKANPEEFARYKEIKAIKDRQRREAIKADPERYAEYKAKAAASRRKRRARIKAKKIESQGNG